MQHYFPGHFKLFSVLDRPVAAVILNNLYEAYKVFIRGLLGDCGLNPEFGELPVKVE